MMKFYEVITAAINDFIEHGFDSMERLEFWMKKIKEAAIRSLVPESVMQQMLQKRLGSQYAKWVKGEAILKMHKGVSRMTLRQLEPKLRAELDRRIMASAGLIKMNRESAIEKTLQRFSGWATSIPNGGSDAVERTQVKATLKKALSALPYEERRVMIDQGHKFVAALNETLAMAGGAIAVEWHSHWRQAGYNYRKDHKERDGKIYAIRDNWAMEKGLMKKGPTGYYDEITAFGEEIFCRCNGRWIYNLRELPPDMLTEKGREALKEARAKIASMMK